MKAEGKVEECEVRKERGRRGERGAGRSQEEGDDGSRAADKVLYRAGGGAGPLTVYSVYSLPVYAMVRRMGGTVEWNGGESSCGGDKHRCEYFP